MNNVESKKGGQPTTYIQIQTPRGLWSKTDPPAAEKRPVYPISTKVEQVIRDVRDVFGFVEDDNKYQLLFGDDPLDPQRPLASYHFDDGALLILSVQGGNALGTVDPAASLEAIRSELALAVKFTAAAGIELDESELAEANLKFHIRLSSRGGETYFASFDCHDYPLFPPYIEFTDAARSRAGTPDLYPEGFHPMPCVCMRYSRKAYSEDNGPHGEWRMLDWHMATDGGGPISTVAMIISDLHSKVLASARRMG